MRRSIIALLIALVLVLVITNPPEKAFKKEMEKIVFSGRTLDDNNPFAFLVTGFRKSLIDEAVEVDNYIVFSIVYYVWGGDRMKVGYGVFNKIYIKEGIKEYSRTKQ